MSASQTTMDKLYGMRLSVMAQAYRDQEVIIAGRLPRRSTLSCHTVPRRAASC